MRVATAAKCLGDVIAAVVQHFVRSSKNHAPSGTDEVPALQRSLQSLRVIMHTIAVNDGNAPGLRACKCYGSGHNRRSRERHFKKTSAVHVPPFISTPTLSVLKTCLYSLDFLTLMDRRK